MANDSSNSQLLHLQSNESSELNEVNSTESSSTESLTVSGDSNSEAEHEHTSQSDSALGETTSKEIEVVPTKSGERKRIRCKACSESSDVVKHPKQRHADQYLEVMGIQLYREKIEYNPVLGTLAKLILCWFWGKYGQRADLDKTEQIQDPQVYFDYLT